jgi:hypothetical protein
MTSNSIRAAIVVIAAFVPGIGLAQHEGHQAGTAQGPADPARCARAQPLVDDIVAAAMARLESARQSNSPVEMRAAVEHLDAALRDIRAQLEPCKAVAAGIPGKPAKVREEVQTMNHWRRAGSLALRGQR